MLQVLVVTLLFTVSYQATAAGSLLQDTLSYTRRPIAFAEAYTASEQRSIESRYYGTVNLVEDLITQLRSWEKRYGQHPGFSAFADSVQLYRATLAKELTSIRQRARTGYDPALIGRGAYWGSTEEAARQWLEDLDVRLHLRTTVERIRDSTDPNWAP